MPQSTTLGLYPVIHVPNLPTPEGWMAELANIPCWLTDSGRLTHKVIIRPASNQAQDRESSPAETSVLPTLLRRQLPNKHKQTTTTITTAIITTPTPTTTNQARRHRRPHVTPNSRCRQVSRAQRHKQEPRWLSYTPTPSATQQTAPVA